MQNVKARLWAFYLPQFHCIPENDKWWGKGFTEWTNVRKAKPLFLGHHQPVEPGELGYYDLMKQPEIRERQAELAREYGIEGFIYWHYWFGGGKMLLEKPFAEVLQSGKPDFPFALAWANESWRGFWHGLDNERAVLIEQTYPGDEDVVAHFNYVLPAFKDKRYLRVEGKPVFFVYHPEQCPNMARFLQLWRKLAEDNGLPRIYFVAIRCNVYGEIGTYTGWASAKGYGFDAVDFINQFGGVSVETFKVRLLRKLLRNRWITKCPDISSWDIRRMLCDWDGHNDVISNVNAGWDHTPRTGINGRVQIDFTPEKFGAALSTMIERVSKKPFDKRIITIKSWNEWAEGNILEPDKRWGRRTLEAVRSAICERA